MKPKNDGFSAVFLCGDYSKIDWYVKSGASMYMTSNEGWLENKFKSNVNQIIVVNSTKLSVKCVGNIVSNTTVKIVLCVPGLTKKLLSVTQLIKIGVM